MAEQTVREDIIKEQYGFAEQVKKLTAAHFGHTPKAFIHTYGCQQNVSDSEVLGGWCREMGFAFTDTAEDADLILFNTCAVREHAEDRVFGNVGALKKLKKGKPSLIIALCGCMVQQEHIAQRVKKSFPYVDILFGTKQRHRFPELVYRHITENRRIFETGGEDKVFEGAPVRREGSIKAWLPIMQGCNNFCTYCIVPYVRGRERSRTPEAVLAEARELVASGVKEIMLLGQNVNSYGKAEGFDCDFADLLEAVNDIPGDFRIRFMTSHPKDCTDKLLMTMARCEKVCKSLHLPVQSGSDRVLLEMNRHYGRQKYLSLIKRARELMPDIAITSDIIVGFPTETEQDFRDTLSLVEQVRYRALFTFIFSKRNGTPAAEMDDQTPDEEKSRRFSELLALQDGISRENAEALIGKRARVLCEEYADGIVSGRDGAGINVSFRGEKELVGQFADIIYIRQNGSVNAGLCK